MNIITPQDYTTNIIHAARDIENNIGFSNVAVNGTKVKEWYDVLKDGIKVHDRRLCELEKKFKDKFGNSVINCISDCTRFLEGVCLWTLVIMLCMRVFN
jgi:hypothetical protein